MSYLVIELREDSNLMTEASRPSLPQSLELDDGSVALRDWRREDAPVLAAVCGEPAVCTFTSVPWTYSRAAAEAWVERQWRQREEGGTLALAIVGAGAEEPLGNVNLTAFRAGEAAFGYWLVPAARGRGLATAAARLLGQWGFGALGLRRIELEIRSDNIASQRVAERLGASREGLRPDSHEAEGRRWDMVVYSLMP